MFDDDGEDVGSEADDEDDKGVKRMITNIS